MAQSNAPRATGTSTHNAIAPQQHQTNALSAHEQTPPADSRATLADTLGSLCLALWSGDIAHNAPNEASLEIPGKGVIKFHADDLLKPFEHSKNFFSKPPVDDEKAVCEHVRTMRKKIAGFPLEASDLPKELVDKKTGELAWKTSRYALWNLPFWERDDGRRDIVKSVVDTLAKDPNTPVGHLDHIKNVELYPLLSSWKAHKNDAAHVTELKKRLILYLVGLLLYSPNILQFEWAELKTALDDEELETQASSSDRTKEQLIEAVERILADSDELSAPTTDQGVRYRERWAVSEFLYGYNWYLRGTETKLDDAGKDVLKRVHNVKLNYAPEQQQGTWEDYLCDHPLPPRLQGKAELKTSKSKTRSSHKHYRMQRTWCGMRNGELLPIIRAKYALNAAIGSIPRGGIQLAGNESATDNYMKAIDTLNKGPFDQDALTYIASYPFEGSTGNAYLDTLYGLQEQLWDASEQERMWTMLDVIGPLLCESRLDGLAVWGSALKRRKLEKKLREAFGVPPEQPFPTDITSCSTTMRDVTYALVYDPNSVLARTGGFTGEITAKNNEQGDDTMYGNLNPGDLLITWDDPSCVKVPEERALPNGALYISQTDAHELARAVANEYGNQSARLPVVVAILGRIPIDNPQMYCTQKQWGKRLPDCSNKRYGGSLVDKLKDVLVRTYKRHELPGKPILTGPEVQSIYDHRVCLNKERTNKQGKTSSPISRIHAAIVYQEDEKGRGTYSYVDLGSTNGALWIPPDPEANSRPIQQRGDSVPLEDHGTLQLGSSEVIASPLDRSVRTLTANVWIGPENSEAEA